MSKKMEDMRIGSNHVICYNCTENHLSDDIKAEVMVYGHTGDIRFL